MLLYLIVLAHLALLPCSALKTLPKFPTSPFPLSQLFNNQAASFDGTGPANFDQLGGSFNAHFLPTGRWSYDGIEYSLPETWGVGDDNLVANGQVLDIPGEDPVYGHEIHFLYAGDLSPGGEFVATFNLSFVDESTQQIQLYARNWFKWPNLNNGAIQSPYHFESNATIPDSPRKNYNTTQIYQWSTAISSEKPLRSVTLPALNPKRRLHIFAITLSPSVSPPGPESTLSKALFVRQAKFTQRWEQLEGVRAQAIEVTLANLLPSYTLSRISSITALHRISIEAPGIKTVKAGEVYRLVPGDQVKVDVFVVGSKGGSASVVLSDTQGHEIGRSEGWEVKALIGGEWKAEKGVLSEHETPSWWRNAKYGIFIHWGVYSYPAWAPPNVYAEWYNWYLHQPNDPIQQHHLQTYGPNITYDTFIQNFTAAKWDPSEWLDVFDNAGAKYFVFVTKHHDGYALFDTLNTTHRASPYLGTTPSSKRDFLAELMATAKKEKPWMKRGTYYSLPEWFNPDYARYGFGKWPGGSAHYPFGNDTDELEPYAGRLEIGNYIDDLQFPHMVDLAERYETDIMWCDIGGPNRTLEFTERFYNNAWKEGRQVTMNNRCGAVPDFDTPEYATFGSTQIASWESNAGMDPHSYGYNSATEEGKYKNATTIVQTLVDVVSKGGNFLLDVGPNAEGEIIKIERDNLLEAGEWIKYSGKCIYDTNYWFQTPQSVTSVQSIRFTTTPRTFCFVAFNRPSGGKLVVEKRLPILEGDVVRLLGPGPDSLPHLNWQVDGETGWLVVDIVDEEIGNGKYAWAFEVIYGTD